MTLPQWQQRRDLRYPLHLPVLVSMSQRKEMRTRSENISLGGILVSSAILIPEGSVVEVSVGVDHLPDPGILLRARGKVLRAHPKDTGEFAIAIQLESSFQLPLKAQPLSDSKERHLPVLVSRKKAAAASRGAHSDLAWHTET
jgi:PilZ domain-containing protein